MDMLSRRSFTQGTLGSLLTFSLLETLYERDAFGADTAPDVSRWFADVNQLGWDLKEQQISQADWRSKLEELLAKVDLPALLKSIDFDKLTKNVTLPDAGARSLRFSFTQIEGAPQKLAYGKQVFAMKKGCSVVPHGHNNMATAFIILQGKFRGKHYDRLADEAKHVVIRPTIDREFGPAEYSTVTDEKDNVHWFKAESEGAFIFNLHAMNITPGKGVPTGRIYLDPNGEKLDDGLIRARRINHDEATKLYG
ncbi:cupin domain-containing protein [Lignipirellula cremea]|uniref:Uncharacterized protein n=1 Tax=Lignipirellula cremea TaxID=2528010 RepID=A0A518E0L0_9BACT|nr:hypothetical protein [Lignipirellula cremea]QDU97617.1 hypothetical protein Pla8534_54670 [Lignipirellula cremea]